MSSRLELEPEHQQFRDSVRGFVRDRIVPFHEQWEHDSCLAASLFTDAGKQGLLGFSVPEEHGGPGVEDYRYNAILIEEVNRAGAAAAGIAFSLQNDVVLPYLTDMANEEQKVRWLPGCVTGETVLGIAMTEPGTGSDLTGHPHQCGPRRRRLRRQRVEDVHLERADRRPVRRRRAHLPRQAQGSHPAGRRGGHPRLRAGSQPGEDRPARAGHQRADLHRHAGARGEPARRGGRGLLPADAEPAAGAASSLSVGAVAAAEGVLADTLEYVRERTAFGSPISTFQNTQFVLAELATEIDIARTYLDDCIDEHVAGELTPAKAARLKWWTTELQMRVVDRCLQLHGGYGYMREYPVARAFVDARIQTIYGGTNEIMKTIVAKDLGL